VQSEIVVPHPRFDVAVAIVWMPMVPTDSEQAAQEEAARLSDPRVAHFYDPDRRVGTAYSAHVFGACAKEALLALPREHPLRPRLAELAEGDPGEWPLWDALLLYRAGTTWQAEPPPPPVRWAKQVAYFGTDDIVTGTFFRNDCRSPPLDSDWQVVVREAMTSMVE
jgi:hypothetical protein